MDAWADTVTNIIYSCDLLDGGIGCVNSGVGKVLGYAPEQIAGMGGDPLFALMHPDDLGGVDDHVQRLKETPDASVVEAEFRLRHADGEWHWVWSRDSVFRRAADGRPRLGLGILQDVTELKRSEEKYRVVFENAVDAQSTTDGILDTTGPPSLLGSTRNPSW